MNCHQSLMNFIINIFLLFVSALALFQAFLYAENVFYFFFLSVAVFNFLFITDISRSSGFAARLCRFFPKGLKNPDAMNIGICNVS